MDEGQSLHRLRHFIITLYSLALIENVLYQETPSINKKRTVARNSVNRERTVRKKLR